jgi:glutaredoxin 3
MVKGYLSRKGLKFSEKNISTDLEARAQLVKVGYRSTPVTLIGERYIVGYKPAALDEALADGY